MNWPPLDLHVADIPTLTIDGKQKSRAFGRSQRTRIVGGNPTSGQHIGVVGTDLIEMLDACPASLRAWIRSSSTAPVAAIAVE